MRHIGLKACALGLALVVIGYSGISGAGLYDINRETLILRLSVDQLRACLNPNNPGYLDIAGYPDSPGYPGTPGYRGPDSLGLGKELDPFKGPYRQSHVQLVLAALKKKEGAERRYEYEGVVTHVDKITNKNFYAVGRGEASYLIEVIDEVLVPGVHLKSEASEAWSSLSEKNPTASDQESTTLYHWLQTRLLSQIFRILTHNCKTQGF